MTIRNALITFTLTLTFWTSAVLQDYYHSDTHPLSHTGTKQKAADVLALGHEMCSKSYPLCVVSIPAIDTVLLFSCTVMTLKTVQFNMNYLHILQHIWGSHQYITYSYIFFFYLLSELQKVTSAEMYPDTQQSEWSHQSITSFIWKTVGPPTQEQSQSRNKHACTPCLSVESVFMYAGPVVCITQVPSSIAASKRPAEISDQLV